MAQMPGHLVPAAAAGSQALQAPLVALGTVSQSLALRAQ